MQGEGNKTACHEGQALPPPLGPHLRREPTRALGRVPGSDGGTSLTSGRGCRAAGFCPALSRSHLSDRMCCALNFLLSLVGTTVRSRLPLRGERRGPFLLPAGVGNTSVAKRPLQVPPCPHAGTSGLCLLSRVPSANLLQCHQTAATLINPL